MTCEFLYLFFTDISLHTGDTARPGFAFLKLIGQLRNTGDGRVTVGVLTMDNHKPGLTLIQGFKVADVTLVVQAIDKTDGVGLNMGAQ